MGTKWKKRDASQHGLNAGLYIALTPFSAHNGVGAGDKAINKIKFKAFVKQFSDQHVGNWSQQDSLFGASPWAYQKTARRVIRISFDVPAFSDDEARENLAKCALISRSIYPEIDALDSGSPPDSSFWELEFANFTKVNNTQNWLKGYIPDYSFTPDFNSGMFYEKEDGESILLPKNIAISLTFNVIADYSEMEYDPKKGTWPKGTEKFPYGIDITKDKYGIVGGKKSSGGSGTPDPVKKASAEKLLK